MTETRKTISLIALAAAVMTVAMPAPAMAEGECIVVQHYYFPLEGKEDEVLAVRIRGNEVRAALGLDTSRLLVVKSSAAGHPAKGPMGPGDASFLMSESEFENEAAAEHADEVLLASKDYLAVRGAMAPLLRHFELAKRAVAEGECRTGGH